METAEVELKRTDKDKSIEESEERRELELQIVERSSASNRRSLFELPNDWIVEERPRSNSRSKDVDRYYYEPGSGRKFRSLSSVQRYLNGEMEYVPQRTVTSCIYEKSIVPYTGHPYRPWSQFQLPPGWTVERRPRSSSHVIDSYYIEPGTGVRFRSLVSVERYLTGMQERREKPSSSLARDSSLQIVLRSPEFTERCTTLPEPSKTNTSQRKKRRCDEAVESSMLDLSNTPSKVKWVLGGARGNLWCAFMDESLVPELVMQTWSKTFILSMQEDE